MEWLNIKICGLHIAPIHESELRGKINVHAHIHDAVIEDNRYVNVDAHKVNYTPIELKGMY